jgi:hypothetical protein
MANQIDPVYQFPAEAYNPELPLSTLFRLVPWAMGRSNRLVERLLENPGPDSLQLFCPGDSVTAASIPVLECNWILSPWESPLTWKW